MQPDSFLDFFHKREEYPSLQTARELFPIGTLYEYVSHSLLNGMINSTPSIISAFMMGRYTDLYEILDTDLKIRDSRDSLATSKIPNGTTKKQLYDLIVNQGRYPSNPELSCFDDDIMCLQHNPASNLFWFFWFDQDVSDCCIGRFQTEVDSAVVRQMFNDFVLNHPSSRYHKPLPLPIEFFNGWCEF